MSRQIACALALVLVACGPDHPPPELPHGEAPPASASPAAAIELRPQTFTTHGHGGSIPTPHSVWIEPARVGGISTDDPCCDLWYDGDQYRDALATCAPPGTNDCSDDRKAVFPGLADDRVCGERRRCVPRPQVRVVSLDGSRVSLENSEGPPLVIADSERAPYQPVHVTREGAFVFISGTAGSELVAVDFGARYTIAIAGGRITRVTRD